MRNAGVMIEWLGNPCHCRCRHCSLGARGPQAAAPLEQAKAIAKRFVDWREQRGASDLYIGFALGYSEDLPIFLDYLGFCEAHGLDGVTACGFLANGIAMRSDSQLEEMCRALQAAGVDAITTTFFGLGERHDEFAGRAGDFDYLMRIARAASACGLKRAEAVYLRRSALQDIPELLAILDAIPGGTGRHVEPWDYRGRAKRQEHDRPLAADVRRLPESVQRYINYDRFKSEAELVARVLNGDIPPRATRYALIPVWRENLGQLESTDCDALLRDCFEASDRFLQSLPSLQDLAQRYGKPKGRRLYALRDLEWKWIDQFLADNPAIDASGAFDERRMTVMIHRSTHDAATAA